MNKLLIGLLIVAAGTGAFLLLRKNEKTEVNSLNKKWILGKWKFQSHDPVIDTTFQPYQYEFQKDGRLLQSLNDSVKADTFYYEWDKVNQLVWKENKDDSTSEVFSVVLLTRDSLRVRGSDSVTVLLTRVR